MSRLAAVERMAAIARDVRAQLLHCDEASRDLAGQCGIASMLMADVFGSPHVLRTGFYMKAENFLGRRGRYPYRHAWCRVDTTIFDVTATQFGRNNRAVHVARCGEDKRYIETARGDAAIDDILFNWHGSESPAYRQLAESLRRSAAAGALTKRIRS